MRYYACMQSIILLRFCRHAQAIEIVRPVAQSVKSELAMNSTLQPCKYGRHAALHRIPRTSFTFSSSFGDNADILGAIPLQRVDVLELKQHSKTKVRAFKLLLNMFGNLLTSVLSN